MADTPKWSRRERASKQTGAPCCNSALEMSSLGFQDRGFEDDIRVPQISHTIR